MKSSLRRKKGESFEEYYARRAKHFKEQEEKKPVKYFSRDPDSGPFAAPGGWPSDVKTMCLICDRGFNKLPKIFVAPDSHVGNYKHSGGAVDYVGVCPECKSAVKSFRILTNSEKI